MTAITPEYLREVRGQHKEALTVPGMCQMCFTSVPCHALVLADAVEALQNCDSLSHKTVDAAQGVLF